MVTNTIKENAMWQLVWIICNVTNAILQIQCKNGTRQMQSDKLKGRWEDECPVIPPGL